MKTAVAVPAIARRKAGNPGGACVGVWGQGSVMAVLLTLSLVLLGEGAPGDLNPTFGVGGKVTTDFGNADAAFALVLQPDGKLVAAGHSITLEAQTANFALARYLPAGSLDPTFGAGGLVTTDLGGFDAAFALVLQPDSKLVAAGRSCQEGTPCDFVLARYLPDGSLDGSFGVGGKVTTDVELRGQVNALVLQPDGKLVAAGETFDGPSDFVLARYLPDGSLDGSFGVGGKVTTDFGSFDFVSALVFQPDGKLVAAGDSGVSFALARYLPDGRLDPTFGVGGLVTTDFGNFDDGGARALVLQPDGNLVAAGFAGPDFALARYEGDESPLVREVALDIKPGSFPNTINPKSHGVLPVAIPTTATFDATTVAPLSVRFGPEGAQEAHGKGHIEDVNHDGEPDLMLHFRTQDTGIKCGDTSASLTGETFNEDPIQGSDSIKTVGCNK
jgi:uncharacterized delta-60 repeat protein